MSAYALWWIAAGALIAVELLTGTFYLLMLSSGVALAGVAALLGAGTVTQLLICAIVSSGSTLAWRRWRRSHPDSLPAEANRDVHLDVGELIHVEKWSSDGTASVRYRGAQWQVALALGAVGAPGLFTIERLEGNRLIVRPH